MDGEVSMRFDSDVGGQIVRSIDHAAASFGLSGDDAEFDEKRRVLDDAYANDDFRALVRFARELIQADTVETVLTRALDVAFGTLPIHRGAIVFRGPTGELVCRVARTRDPTEYRPQDDILVSRTIIERAMRDRVAIVTENALNDERFSGAESVWRRGIRAAVCVPLWCGERVIGAVYADSPLWARAMNQRDVDFLVALANVTAVATERLRERNARTRLQRYHAPAVVEQVLRDESAMSIVQTPRRAEVTVLFADLVGFTALAESMSPEDVAELLTGFCTRAADAVFLEGGTLDKFIGDCVMAFFGAPIQLPNHAVQGVRTAFRIQDTIHRWNDERARHGLPALQVRVGINSGPVVIGEVGNDRRADYSVVGNTVNVAARLEEMIAAPGDIVIGESTQRLIGDAFDSQPLGEVTLRGLERPVAAYRVRRRQAVAP